MKFKKLTINKERRQELEKSGSVLQKAYSCARGKHYVIVMVIDEPTGVCGEMERHVSISASTLGRKRSPRRNEVQGALEAVAIKERVIDATNHGGVVHVWHALDTNLKTED